MIGIHLLLVAGGGITYDVLAIVKKGPGSDVYIVVDGKKIDRIDTTRSKLVKNEILRELITGRDLRVVAAEDVPESSKVFIVVKYRGREVSIPMPRFIKPPVMVPSGSPIPVEVRMEGVSLADFKDPRVYLIRADSSSEAFALTESEKGTLVGEIKGDFSPGTYTIAFVVNSQKYNLELRVYRKLTILFPLKYRFSSAASGFEKQKIHYCLEVENSENVSNVNASVDVERDGMPIISLPLTGLEKYWCTSIEADAPGKYIGRLTGVVQGFFEGTPVDIPIQGEVEDEVLFRFDSASVEKDRGVKYDKPYKAWVYISSANGNGLPLRVLGVVVENPDSIQINAEVGKEIMVENSTPVELTILFPKGTNRDGVYPFRLMFRDATGGKKYFIDLELHAGKSGWEILKQKGK